MKKILSLMLMLAMLCMVSGAMADTFAAEAQGNNGPVKVEVDVEDGAVTAVRVTEHKETAGIADAPIEKIPAAIVATQSLNIDVVTGATNTSNAILSAAAAALTEAGIDAEAWKTKEVAAAAPVAKTEDITVKTVVVGAGGAGMKTAIDLTKAGHDVLLIEKQYMFGPDYLVAPVMEPGVTQMEIYLPEGKWQNIDTLEILEGGRHVTVPAPLDVIPVMKRM